MEISYRRLNPHESYSYRLIRLESLQKYPESYGSTYEEEKEVQKLEFEKHIDEQKKDKFVIGSFDKIDLVGICGFTRDEQKKSQHKGSIIQMYIKPDYQRKGIGSQLLQITIKEIFAILEIEQIILGVTVESQNALRIYKKAGFQEYGFQKRYFKANNNYYDQKLLIINREDYSSLLNKS